MQGLALLVALLVLPYLMVGIVWPLLLLGEPEASHASDLVAFSQASGVLACVWIVAFAGARWLVRRGAGAGLADEARWTIVFPATLRLFALAAPAALGVGVGTGVVLVVLG